MTAVDKDVVAKYYIECELDNIVVGDNVRVREDLYNSSTSRLLEALSFTYRANSVFDYIESGMFDWQERTVAINDIELAGMGENLTAIIYSNEVQQSPRKLIEYIKNHPDDSRLSELQPRPIPDNRQIILLRQDGSKLKMLDGSHRFLSMVMNGAETVDAYVAVITNRDVKPMIGDTVFLRLRRLWQQTEDLVFRESIERTVAGMIAATRNGTRSVEMYWITMGPNDEVRAVGRRLLEASEQPIEGSIEGVLK